MVSSPDESEIHETLSQEKKKKKNAVNLPNFKVIIDVFMNLILNFNIDAV